MPTVLLVRHAQASFGSADYDVLSPAGLEQSALLATALEHRQLTIGRVVCGTARRQRETATACLTATGLEIETDERWDEYETEQVLAHHATVPAALDGTGSGGQEITSREFQGVLDGALADWAASGEGTAASQTWPFFLESRASALGELAAGLGSGETGLVFTSGGVIAAICARLLGGDGELFPRLNRVLVNTGITKIAVGRSGASLVTFNEHAHIDEGGGALLTYR
ncbi:MAG TPA: histidine phosphatase family protein [Solirubrobacterales bacterium]|nr:histidine phosphatase family protein [Solirubrobacterales bacterium]